MLLVTLNLNAHAAGPLASDTFNRTVANGWGVADSGGAWTVQTNAGNWSVAPGSGTVVTNSNSSEMGTLPVSVQDVDALAKITLRQPPNGGSYIAHLLLRYQSASSFYAVGVYQTGGSADVQAFALNGSNVQLIPNTDTGIKTADNNRLWVRAEAQGINPTALRIRVWQDGAAEPTGWLAATTDSTSAQQSAGIVGLHTYNASGSAETMVVGNFQVNPISAVDYPPTVVVTVTPTNGTAPLNVTADASGSTDGDSTPIASFTFKFGDGVTVGPQAGATAAHTYTSAASYTISTTVTDTGGLSGATTSPVSVGSSGGTQTIYASDTFNRTVGNGWGSANVGGAWAVQTNAGNWSVAPGSGTIVTSSSSAEIATLPVNVQDVDALARVTLHQPPSGSSYIAHLLLRYQSASSFYAVGVYQTGGSANVQAHALNGSNVQIIPNTDTGIKAGDNNRLWIRAEAQGINPTTLRIRVWQDGAAEPTSWLAAASDSTTAQQGPGTVGLHTYNASGGTETTVVGNVQVTTVAGVDSPPTAVVAINPTTGTAPLNVTADASGSTDNDGTPIASYTFNFGDGTVSGPQAGAIAAHIYTSAGGYTITTTVTDKGGLSSTNTSSVSVASSVGTPTTFASDTFNRIVNNGWGSADVGGAWSGAGSSLAVTPGAATLVANPATTYNYLPSVSGQDVDLLSFLTPPTGNVSTTDGGIGVRYAPSSSMFYQLSAYYSSGGNYSVQLKYKPSNVLINNDVATSIPGGSPLWFRLEAQGTNPTTLRWRVWEQGTAEPTTWSGSGGAWAAGTGTDGTQGLQGPGGVAVQAYDSSGTDTWTVNCLVETNVSQPAPTSACPTPAPPPPPPQPNPGTVIGQDTFQRANQAHWGTASDGNVWGADASTNAAFSITNNTGQIASSGGNYTGVLGPTVANALVLLSGSQNAFASGANSNMGAVIRWTDNNNWYKAYIEGANLVVQKKVAGRATILASTPFAAGGGVNYSLRFQVVGTTLQAKVWQTGTVEPGWMVSATDSSLSSGHCGVRALTPSGYKTTFTSFSAASL